MFEGYELSMLLFYSILHTAMIQIEYNTNREGERESMICMRGEDFPTWSSILKCSPLYFFSIFLFYPISRPIAIRHIYTATASKDQKGADTT